MAEELWYYEKDGEQHGPVTREELQALIEIGEISRENLAWKPGERDWSETGTFEVLMPSFKTPPRMQTAPAPPPVPASGLNPAAGAAQGEPAAAAAGDREVSPSLSLARTEVMLPAPVAPPQDPPEALTAEIVPPAPDLPPIPHVPVSQLPVPQVPAPPAVQPQALPHPQAVPTVRVEKSLFDRVAASVMLLANLKTLLATTGVTVVVVVAVVWWNHWRDRPVHPSQQALHGTVVPAGYRGPVGQIKIDAYPWAELSGLSRGGRKLDVPGSAVTPLVLLVAPGSYRVELGSFSCELDLAEGASRTCRKVVRTIDAAAYYQEVGW